MSRRVAPSIRPSVLQNHKSSRLLCWASMATSCDFVMVGLLATGDAETGTAYQSEPRAVKGEKWVIIPYRFKRTGGRKQIIAPEGAPAAKQDDALVRAVVRGHRWQGMLDAGQVASVQELAVKENVDPSYLARHLRLAFLAPDIVEGILFGTYPEGLTLGGLMVALPGVWGEQRQRLGFPARE